MVAYDVPNAERRQARLPGPHHLTRAANLQVLLRYLESIAGLFHYRQTLASFGRAPVSGKQYAIALLVAAANSPPKLMKLRESKPFSVFDDHDARVRHVDSY